MTEPAIVATDDAVPPGAADPAWARALTLAERVVLGPSPSLDGDRARARRRLARWRRRTQGGRDAGDPDGLRQKDRLPEAERTREVVSERFQSINALPIPWVEPVDISNAVLWLASDESRYVTGVTLPIDAGELLK